VSQFKVRHYQSLRAGRVFRERCYNPLHVKRIPSLDGLRAISISLVIGGHLANWGHAPGFLTQYANLGVRIFFVISGYLITTILLREHVRTGTISVRDFYIRRAYRIFPAAMCFLAVIFVFYWPRLRGYEILATMFYLANFLPYRLWILGHLWSLSVEEQFYFLWPSVLRRWYRHRTTILCAAILVTPIARTMFFFFRVPHGGYGNLLTVGDTLATGCLLAVLGARVPTIPWQAATPMVFALVLVPLCHGDSRHLTILILFVLSPVLHFSIAGILLHVVQHPYRFLNLAPVVWLGNISYSLYLWQQVFLDPLSSLRYGVLWAVGLACVSYYLVEKPMLRLRDRSGAISKSKAMTMAA
jgi:peptidoglycan/LPS O-acetylase OafA/YrhL